MGSRCIKSHPPVGEAGQKFDLTKKSHTSYRTSVVHMCIGSAAHSCSSAYVYALAYSKMYVFSKMTLLNLDRNIYILLITFRFSWPFATGTTVYSELDALLPKDHQFFAVKLL